ncbi:hypothetical protein HN865_01915 [Candidatus Woesearchaeota archaeon]|jgi:hypothetical protein|nr:hypothetical protein [Cryomorphaceae bacterium]MBT6995763.1 hypothetical protein [Candidatus Woesearchaeota archaeon]MBT7237591.1 hypothetical protein [Candidatus Woesearchaeota archaeon]
MNKQIFIVVLFFSFIFISGCATNVPCGGWDLAGETICECDGELIKDICSEDADCDGETYLCEGTCGSCIYEGIEN